MNPNRQARIRAMARSYIGSMRLEQLLGKYGDYSGNGYDLVHRHLQEFLEELSDEDAEHFMYELSTITGITLEDV